MKTIALAMGSFMAVSALTAALPFITALVHPDVSASSPSANSTAISAAYTTQNEVELAHIRYALLRDQYRDKFDPGLR